MKEQEQSVRDVNLFGKCKEWSTKKSETMEAREGDVKEERSPEGGQ